MGKVITFKPREKTDPEAIRLMKIADAIDAVILEHLGAGSVDARDMAALLSHRLGTLISHIEDKQVTWDFCQKVLREQAKVDKIS